MKVFVKKKLVQLSSMAVGISFMGCAATAVGVSDDKLIETVSFDTSCPKEKIEILQKTEDSGTGNYLLKACDKEIKYKRAGTVYYDANKKPY